MNESPKALHEDSTHTFFKGEHDINMIDVNMNIINPIFSKPEIYQSQEIHFESNMDIHF